MRIKNLMRVYDHAPSSDDISDGSLKCLLNNANSERFTVVLHHDLGLEVDGCESADYLAHTNWDESNFGGVELFIGVEVRNLSNKSSFILRREEADTISGCFAIDRFCYWRVSEWVVLDSKRQMYAIHPNRNILAVAYLSLFESITEASIDFWDLDERKLISCTSHWVDEYPDCITFSSSGRFLLCRTTSAFIETEAFHDFVRSHGGRPHPNDNLPSLEIYDFQNTRHLSLSVPCKDIFIIPGTDDVLIVHRVGVEKIEPRKDESRLLFKFDSVVRGATFSPSGTIVAVYRDSAIEIWSVEQGIMLHKHLTKREVKKVTFSDEGRVLLVSHGYEDEDIEVLRLVTDEWDINQLRSLSPREFENLIAQLFKELGWRVEQTTYTRDGGYDAVVYKAGKKVLVECKRFGSDQVVGGPHVMKFLGAMSAEHADGGVFISTSRFTQDAKLLASKNAIELWGEDKLLEMLRIALPS